MSVRSLKTRIVQLVASNHRCITSEQGKVLEELTRHLILRHHNRQKDRENLRLVLDTINELAEEKTILVERDPERGNVIYRLAPVLTLPPHPEGSTMTATDTETKPSDETSWPPLMADYRDRILRLLIGQGGSIEDPNGQVRSRVRELLELPDTKNESARLSTAFGLMEKAELITRHINGRRTDRMRLADTLATDQLARLRASVQPPSQESEPPAAVPESPTPTIATAAPANGKLKLEECYQIICLLTLSRRPEGIIDDETGYATRILLGHAGFTCSYTPPALTSAMATAERNGLIYRRVEGGRCFEIKLVRPLTEALLSQLRLHSTEAADRVEAHLKAPEPKPTPAMADQPVTLAVMLAWCETAYEAFKAKAEPGTNQAILTGRTMLREVGIPEDYIKAVQSHLKKLDLASAIHPVEPGNNYGLWVYYVHPNGQVDPAKLEQLMELYGTRALAISPFAGLTDKDVDAGPTAAELHADMTVAELAIKGSHETSDLMVFVINKSNVPERQAGLHGDLLTIIDAFKQDRVKLLQRLSTQDQETTDLKHRLESAEHDLRQAQDDLELARDPSLIRAQTVVEQFRSQGLEGLG